MRRCAVSADNPWAFYMAMSNHLRVNNDTSFLTSRAASARLNLTVEEALEGIVTDFEVRVAVAPSLCGNTLVVCLLRLLCCSWFVLSWN